MNTDNERREAGNDLLRALLVAQVRLAPVVKEAVKLYREAESDYQFAQQLEEKILEVDDQQEIGKLARENASRAKRRRAGVRQQLLALGVHRQAVNRGEAFDATQHSQVGETPAVRADLEGRIAHATSDLFTWKDHCGQEQFIAADVVLYGRAIKAEATSMATKLQPLDTTIVPAEVKHLDEVASEDCSCKKSMTLRRMLRRLILDQASTSEAMGDDDHD